LPKFGIFTLDLTVSNQVLHMISKVYQELTVKSKHWLLVIVFYNIIIRLIVKLYFKCKRCIKINISKATTLSNTKTVVLSANTAFICPNLKLNYNQAWWYTPIVQVLRKLKKENSEFQASTPSYRVRSYLKKISILHVRGIFL
jgi:hypothetical protein